MCEDALRLRRRCLFLSDEAVIGTALQSPDVVGKVDDILLRTQRSESTAACDSTDLDSCIRRWQQTRQFADWQECVEWLLFRAEWQREEGGCGDAANVDSALCRQTVLDLATLFSEEARAYDAAAESFEENYWRREQKRRRRVLTSNGVHEEGAPLVAGTRVCWSIAAELPSVVEQVFLHR